MAGERSVVVATVGSGEVSYFPEALGIGVVFPKSYFYQISAKQTKVKELGTE